MEQAFIRFRVPENVDGIAERLENNWAVYRDGANGDVTGEGLADELEANAGELMDFYFEDHEQPGDAIDDMMAILEKRGAPYFGYSNSYTEQSRSERFLAVIACNCKGDAPSRKLRTLDWHHGEPDIAVVERQMELAGFESEEINEAMETFNFERTPAPRAI